jgi:hypothetical protein
MYYSSEAMTPGSLPVLNMIEELTRFEPLHDTTSLREEGYTTSSVLMERVAEREALVSLIESINTDLLHKDVLLTALVKLEELVNCRLPPDALQEQAVFDQLKTHRSWLEDSIRRTNIALDKKLKYLSFFYGRAYLPKE